VILWRGSHRYGSTRSKANGSYFFARSARLRGHRVRVTVRTRTLRTEICAAGSSKVIHA
jgi:hypothetical protein